MTNVKYEIDSHYDKAKAQWVLNATCRCGDRSGKASMHAVRFGKTKWELPGGEVYKTLKEALHRAEHLAKLDALDDLNDNLRTGIEHVRLSFTGKLREDIANVMDCKGEDVLIEYGSAALGEMEEDVLIVTVKGMTCGFIGLSEMRTVEDPDSETKVRTTMTFHLMPRELRMKRKVKR